MSETGHRVGSGCRVSNQRSFVPDMVVSGANLEKSVALLSMPSREGNGNLSQPHLPGQCGSYPDFSAEGPGSQTEGQGWAGHEGIRLRPKQKSSRHFLRTRCVAAFLGPSLAPWALVGVVEDGRAHL